MLNSPVNEINTFSSIIREQLFVSTFPYLKHNGGVFLKRFALSSTLFCILMERKDLWW